ncbi:lysylphosphatidylglycerol synthase transmembrane domain-containing protein [Micromonospora sp. NPDC004704]
MFFEGGRFAKGTHTTPTVAPPARGVPVIRPNWALVRTVSGIGILAVLLWWLGTGPFLDGLRLIDGWALAAALGIGALTTVCCAWRWSLIAGGLGVRLPLGTAVAACYRAVFLNSTLPGGVLGDVHRAVRHGRDTGDVGRGIRAVVWERTAGQVVQAVLAVAVLLALPSPVRPYLPAATALVVTGVLGAVLLARVLPRRGPSRWARALRTTEADVREGLIAHGKWAGVLIASTVVVAGHLATFLVAARTAGVTAPLSQLVPLTFLALLAMSVPANVAGFGPREGVAAWAFGAAGLTASQGISTAMVYGALVLVASLPGAAVLLIRRVRVPAVVPAVVPRRSAVHG